MDTSGLQQEMPGCDDARLHVADHGAVVEVRRGGFTISAYRKDDLGMRNLTIIALAESGISAKTVAGLLGLSQVQVSRIRSDYREHGSAGLARRQGRPPKLTASQIRQARLWAGEGVKHGEIARRLRVSRPLIVALLKQHGKLFPQAQQELPATGPDAGADAGTGPDADAGPDAGTGSRQDAGPAWPALSCGGLPVLTGSYRSRYAGAMLTHAFTSLAGTGQILAGACGLAGSDAAADLAVLNATRISFTLGALTIEQTKHLASAQAGPLIGLPALPSARAWRPRLAAIGDAADPLELQRRMTAAMLAFAPPKLAVFFADDHMAEYTGGKPAGWGRNPRRGKPTRGHDDTYTCDLDGRGLVFATGEPSGLSLTLPPVLDQLTAAGGKDDGGPAGRPVVVFDRGASYPKTFTAVQAAGYDWIAWRRAPLAASTRLPVLAAIRQYGTDREVAFADEQISINGYEQPARQITLFEHGKPVAQLLTSCLHLCAGLLLSLLRARWIIENFLKYNAANYGIDTLADYAADLTDDTRLTPSPARKAAKAAETRAAAALSDARAALATMLADPAIPAAEKNGKLIPAAEKAIARCQARHATAATALKATPAKVPYNELHPGAQRALLRPGRRLLQLVLRILAANAEACLADALNTYLHDDDEYRAITRETILRGLDGTITYTPASITVTLDQPSQPRVADALAQLLKQLNHNPPTIPGDKRPITYQLLTTA